jgi:hypothetical protein
LPALVSAGPTVRIRLPPAESHANSIFGSTSSRSAGSRIIYRTGGEDIKEIYAEAKGTGFEPKIMRQLIKIRKMGKGEHDEQESLLDLYKRAIGMLPEAGPSAQAAE